MPDGSVNPTFRNRLADTLVRRTSAVMTVLVPVSAPKAPLPLLMAPAFQVVYKAVLRQGVVPLILAARPVHKLEQSQNWSSMDDDRFDEIVADPTGTIADAWDRAWTTLWIKASDEPVVGTSRRAAVGPARSQPRKSSGGLFSAVANFFTREEPARPSRPAPAKAPVDAEPSSASTGFRDLVEQHARANGYHVPREDDLDPLGQLFRVEAAPVAQAWDAINDMHTKEFKPIDTEGAPKGSLLDTMRERQMQLPPRIGEMLMIRAATDLEYCDAPFVKQLIRLSASSQEAGERALPWLTEYQRSLPRVIR